MFMRHIALALALVLCGTLTARAQEVDSLLATIKAVGREGAGNVAAAKAWKALVQHGPKVLPATLAAMDDASPLARNWLRTAVEATVDQAVGQKQQMPVDKLEAFIRDTRHAGSSRRMAYEALVRVDDKAPARLLPGMLDDPGQELRRDAVAVLLERAQVLFDKSDPGALPAYKQALNHARDRDQLNQIAERLKKLGQDVDLTKHYGFITRWQVIGPFDSRKGIGFAANYPPEQGFDPKAVYAGIDAKQVRWQLHETTKGLGVVDFNKAIDALHGVVAYAHTAVTSPVERPVEIRAGSNNAIRIYLNGQEIYFREEYHHGQQMDQHVGRGTLKAGRNEILVKVCQNEQTENWAQQWSFQLRITDAIGGAIPVTVE